MARVFIIHGWGGYPEEGWFPWLKEELEKKGFDVNLPAMPDTDDPKIEVWIPFLKKLVGKIDKDTYLIGHSIGCQTILRYIEGLPSSSKVGGMIFVAGWFKLANLEYPDEEKIAKPWLTLPINFSKIKEKTNSITTILSENDPYNETDYNKETFKTKLNSKIIIEKSKGHFSGSDNVNKLPVVLNELMDMVK